MALAGQRTAWSQHRDHIPQGQPWIHHGTKSHRITEARKGSKIIVSPPDKKDTL